MAISSFLIQAKKTKVDVLFPLLLFIFLSKAEYKKNRKTLRWSISNYANKAKYKQ